MEAFFPDLLDRFLDTAFMERVCKKFHYWESQIPELRAVAENMLPLIRREAGWERRDFCCQGRLLLGKYKRGQTDADDTVYEKIVMSLGCGLDDLQEDYTKKGMLSESYMLEVLASELLLDGYGAYNRYIREHTFLHVTRYHFFGSEEDYPLEMLPQMLSGLAIHVTCNEAFCMQPKKSAVFVSELTQDEGAVCQGICIGCNSTQCSNRIKDKIRKEVGEIWLEYYMGWE